jgi:vancomycin resistance protein YoaR
MRNLTLKKIFFLLLITLSSLIIIAIGFYAFFTIKFDNKVYPGVSLGAFNLAGLSYEDADKLIQEKTQAIMDGGLKFSYQNQEKMVNPGLPVDLNIDAYGPVVSFDNLATLKSVYEHGRHGGLLQNLGQQIFSLFFKNNLAAQYDLDENQLRQNLINYFQSLEIPVKNADLSIKFGPETDSGFTYEVTNEQAGRLIDYDQAVVSVHASLANLKNEVIYLNDKIVEPQILKTQVPDVNSEIENYLNSAPITLQYTESSTTPTWKIKANKEDVALWLGLAKDNGNKIVVELNIEKLTNFLQERVAKQVDREPTRAKFEIKNGKVSSFQTSADGLKLNLEQSIDGIKNYFVSGTTTPVDLVVDKIQDNSPEEVNAFGVKEIIGTGHSNFAGSPKNRRHNIRVGAAAVNGLLIKPGEEFSLVKTLGEIDASTGYLPELVIKENKTIPEYGGGLCQIGTTVFRSALESGLPITARRNHSYRVAYYEPAGMDAAVYIPQPDVRFLNDTNNYILIQSRIAGDDIYFDFWGVSDGRQVEITKPVVYNIVKPAATKIVETTDLKPGEKKCTERAHNGADAYFDYKVTYNPNTDQASTTEKRFSSHYVPWQEVCLLGVKQITASSTPNTNTGSSTATSTAN